MFNYTVKIIIPQVRPYLYVKNYDFLSPYKVAREAINLLPPFKRKFYGVDYVLGMKNKTGHYNGMIGSLERDDVDLVFYPLPIDLSDPPGIFTPVFWESSTYIISLASLPSNKHLDISSSLLNFDFTIIFCFIFSFIILSLFTSKVLKLFTNFFYAFFTFFCLTLRQDSNVIVKKKFRSFFLIIVFYHFFLIMLFEISVSSNLVVTARKDLINTIDDLYKKKEYLPFFIKGHFILNYFVSSYNNEKIKKIFQRVSKCDDCIQKIEEHVTQVSLYRKFNFEKKAFIFDRSFMNIFKNLYCSSNHEKINFLGNFHTSLPITKNYFALLMNKKLKLHIQLLFNKRVTALRENNLSERLFYGLDQVSFLDFRENSFSFKKCMIENNSNNLKNRYEKIKIINILNLMSAVLICFFIHLTLFSFHFILLI